MTAIAVVNKSTLVSTADVKTMVQACATQIKRDAAPAWGKAPIPVVYLSSEHDAQPGMWVVVVLDNADQAGALGYHSERANGVIYGRVFAKPVLDNGGDGLHKPLSVASVLSHECLEILADPNCNLFAQVNEDLVCLEIADPVEDLSYAVGGITVSNFVLPSWFDANTLKGTKVDFLGKLPKPFTLAPGGYAVIVESNGQPKQVFGEKYAEWRKEAKRSELARTSRRLGER
jgi:hypothetical protein